MCCREPNVPRATRPRPVQSGGIRLRRADAGSRSPSHRRNDLHVSRGQGTARKTRSPSRRNRDSMNPDPAHGKGRRGAPPQDKKQLEIVTSPNSWILRTRSRIAEEYATNSQGMKKRRSRPRSRMPKSDEVDDKRNRRQAQALRRRRRNSRKDVRQAAGAEAQGRRRKNIESGRRVSRRRRVLPR